MKKTLLTLAMLFTFSTAFISCRDTPNESNEVELNNEDLEVEDDAAEENVNEVPREQGVGEIDDQ
ncbi:hypothetical protein GCM10007103_25350 [Salinimicrobium marinum]|uniref:Secreted protein n=1 Tax=Salinimicrobium marinum TaxID=680283 RepID=A0A918SHM5_9FLAO|nr:hypothetical protein [Salinimicrobium marinum]GHA43070.1 hypothetical protein GCM10007103_25350 [Salinimicrobium marinum]